MDRWPWGESRALSYQAFWDDSRAPGQDGHRGKSGDGSRWALSVRWARLRADLECPPSTALAVTRSPTGRTWGCGSHQPHVFNPPSPGACNPNRPW